jgi:2'-5' RNA ligase
MSDAPLILTLTLDNETQTYFNQLREAHFPPERNYLAAHLTLFHHLPPHQPQIIDDIKLLVQQNTTLTLQVTEVKSIGNGVAYQLDCPLLLQLHKQLQQQWFDWLTPQDRQKLWPHVTVQNKVSPEQARMLKAQLTEEFEPFTATGLGLSLFEYQNGPWKFISSFDFEQTNNT